MSKISLDSLDPTSVQAASLAMERIKSDIITQTLDKLNAPASGRSGDGGMSQTYDFAKSVLGGAYLDKGSVIDTGDSCADIVTQTLDKLNSKGSIISSGS